MATSLDQWTRELNEASKLAEDISAMISERGSLPPSGPDTQRHLTAMRRKITILRTRLESLESFLSKIPSLHADPRLLLRDVEKTLAPKFRALQDLGFSCSDITHLVRSNNHVISHKSQTILPKIQCWQDLLGSNDFLVNLCKKNRMFLGYSIEKRIQPNIEILRDYGITDQKLSMILRQYPLVITRNSETLKALISRVDGLGVARTSGMFLLILSVLQSISEKKFKAHMEFFKGFGWSEDDFLAAFRKAPTLVRYSLKSSQRKMEFLVNEAGCAPSYLALVPYILLFSLEKRLMPRHQIVTGLKSMGVCISNLSMYTYMKYTEKKFVEKFVNCYKEYPELIELYNVAPKNRNAL